MSFFSKLFSRKPQPGTRVRVSVECGMPVAEHKHWCSILRNPTRDGRQEQNTTD